MLVFAPADVLYMADVHIFHADYIVGLVALFFGKRVRGKTAAVYLESVEHAAGAVVYGVARFFVAGRGGSYIVFVARHIFEKIFRHRRTAYIAVTDEDDGRFHTNNLLYAWVLV